MSAYDIINFSCLCCTAEITCSCFSQLLGVSIEVFILLVQLLCLVTSKIIDYLVSCFLFHFPSSQARSYIISLPRYPKKDFATFFNSSNPLAVDLLEQTLQMDPDCRITVESALAHPYLATYADPDDEVRFSKTDTTTKQIFVT